MNEENKNLNNPSVLDNPDGESAAEENTPSVETSAQSKPEKDKSGKKKPKKEKKKKSAKTGRPGIKEFLKSRKARHGSVAIAIVIAVTAIVIVLNIICSLLTDRFPSLKLDMTSNGAYALQEDTEDYVSHLSKDVTINVLLSKDDFESYGTYTVQAENLMEKMVSASGGKLSLEYVDLTSNPTFTANYTDVDWTSSDAMILVECGSEYKVLSLTDCFEYDESYYYYYGSLELTGTTVEQAVVTAILNVTTDDKPIADIITSAGSSEDAYSGVREILSDNAYQVNEVSLTTGDIDEDADLVILFAPTIDLDESAIEKLSDWLDNDGEYGKTFMYIPTADIGDTPNLDDFLSEWGLSVDKGYVFETSSDYLVSSSTPYAFVVDYGDYYTDGLKNSNIPCVVTEAHQVSVTDETNAHTILQTSENAGVYPLDASDDWDYNDALTGEPISVAAEGVKTNSDSETSNVVVFGSYLMFDEEIMGYTSYNNSAFFMNVCNTNTGQSDSGIVIESKSLESTELGVTNETTKNVIMIIFIIIIPVAVIIAGIVLWVRRRNK